MSSEPPVDRQADDENRDHAESHDSDVAHVKVWDSTQILGGSREAIILHGDQAYRLLCTRNGKLILQK